MTSQTYYKEAVNISSVFSARCKLHYCQFSREGNLHFSINDAVVAVIQKLPEVKLSPDYSDSLTHYNGVLVEAK